MVNLPFSVLRAVVGQSCRSLAILWPLPSLQDRDRGRSSKILGIGSRPCASSQRTSDSELDVAKDDIEELRGQITDLQNEVNSIDTSPPSSGDSNN